MKKTAAEIWNSRNPENEINSDTGDNMFERTMIMCMEEYAEQRAIEYNLWVHNPNNYQYLVDSSKTDKDIYKLFLKHTGA